MATHRGIDVEDAARLEWALLRIAQAQEAAREAALKAVPPEPQEGALSPAATEEAARRLDTVIADIRAVLGKASAD